MFNIKCLTISSTDRILIGGIFRHCGKCWTGAKEIRLLWDAQCTFISPWMNRVNCQTLLLLAGGFNGNICCITVCFMQKRLACKKRWKNHFPPNWVFLPHNAMLWNFSTVNSRLFHCIDSFCSGKACGYEVVLTTTIFIPHFLFYEMLKSWSKTTYLLLVFMHFQIPGSYILMYLYLEYHLEDEYGFDRDTEDVTEKW